MNMFDGFERYEKSRAYSEKISIAATGGISFNTTAYEELNLDRFCFAAFFYNKENKNIGIRFSHEKLDGAYQLKPRVNAKQEKALYLSIKGFVMTYKPIQGVKVQKYKIVNKAENNGILDVILSPIIE